MEVVQKLFSSARLPNAKSCSDCWYDESGYCRKLQAKILTKEQARLCDFYTVEQPVQDLSTVTDAVEATTDAVSEVKGEVETLQEKTEDVTSQVGGVDESTQAVTAAVGLVADAVGASNSKLDSVKTSTDGISTTLGTTNGKLDTVKSATDLVKTSVDSAKTAIDSTKTAVDAVASAVGSTKSAVDLTKAAVDLTKTAVNAVQSKTADVETAVSAVYEKNLDLETAIGATNSKLDTLQGKTDDVKAAVDDVRDMVARPAWYDRNAVSKTFTFIGASVAPHGLTQRWFYSVPTGRKAFVESLVLSVQRLTPPSAIGLVSSQVLLTPNGESTLSVVSAAETYATTGEARGDMPLGQSLILFEGDTLQAYTQDDSADGTCRILNCMKITEFDA